MTISTTLGQIVAQAESGQALPDGPWTRPGTTQTYSNGLFQQFSGFILDIVDVIERLVTKIERRRAQLLGKTCK
jgi:hypothetical protein